MQVSFKVCKYCGKEYQNIYYTNGYAYTANTEFCSKSCASKSRSITQLNSPIKQLPPKEVIVDEIKEFINGEGKYCTTTDITTGIKRSSKTLTKLGISVKELNAEFGFEKPKSAFEEKVGKVLSDEFGTVEREVTFEGLKGEAGWPLRVDFYIPDKNVVIESDGSHHHDVNHPWNSNGVIKSQENDAIKDNYFSENNIKLVRIPYNKRANKKYILDHLKDI